MKPAQPPRCKQFCIQLLGISVVIIAQADVIFNGSETDGSIHLVPFVLCYHFYVPDSYFQEWHSVPQLAGPLPAPGPCLALDEVISGVC